MIIRTSPGGGFGPLTSTKTKRSRKKQGKNNKCPLTPSSSSPPPSSTKKSCKAVSSCPKEEMTNNCVLFTFFLTLVSNFYGFIGFMKKQIGKILNLHLLWTFQFKLIQSKKCMSMTLPQEGNANGTTIVANKTDKKRKKKRLKVWNSFCQAPSWNGLICLIKTFPVGFAFLFALTFPVKVISGFVRSIACQVGQLVVRVLEWPAIFPFSISPRFQRVSNFSSKTGVNVTRSAAELLGSPVKIFKRPRSSQPRLSSNEWTIPIRSDWTAMAFSSSSSSSTSSLSPPVGSPYMPRRVAENAAAGRGPPAPLMHGQDGIYLPPHRGEEPAARKGAIFKIMECHMEWIGDLMPMYQTTEEKEAYLNKIIQTMLEWLEEIKNRVVTPGTALLTRLMLAGFHAYLCQFNEALEWINEAVDNLATLAAEESPAHMRAYAYLLKANFYKINRKMKLMEGTPMKVLEQETAQEIKEIESLFDENGRSFHALLHIAKGILASKMVHQELQIESFRMAIELEPTCSHWHRLLYQALRKKRRETVRRPPTYEEKDAIRKAYDLDPDFCLNQTYYASMLEEKMKGAKDRELILEGNKQEIGDEIIHLMESALEKNPEDRWTTVRLAEIYAYGKFPHLDSKDGERMFEDCEERWPDCSMVLHKFGLYFAMTANNPQKALEYYTRSLESDSGNFPCLMDYLKTSHRVGRDKKQMLEMIDRCLGPVCLHNIGPQVRMLIAKGILLWSIDSNNGGEGARKQEACQAWIEAVKKDIKSAGFVVSRITAGYWDILGEYSIDVVKLENMLNVFQSLASSARDLEQEKAIRGLRMELHNHELNDQRPFGLELRYRTTSGSSSSARSSVSNSSYATARTSFSRADSVINWRESSSQPPPLVGGSGVFATYQDPMELRFRGGFNPVALNLGLVTMSNGYPNVDNGRGGMPKKKATPTHDSKPCIADLDNDWRR